MDATLSDLFQHYWCFASRSSLLFFNYLLWNFTTSWMLLYQLFLNIIDAMLCFKIFSSFFDHRWCGALRSYVQLSNIMVSTFEDLLFKFLPSLMLGRSCLQFANLVAAPLEGLVFDFQTFYHYWCYDPKSSLQFSNVMHAAYAELQELVLHVLTSLALRSKWTSRSSLQHSNIFHRWRYAVRSSLQVSIVLPSLLTFYHHWCYTLRIS